MPTKKIAIPREIYQIKVTLAGTEPPIWRRLLVPANFTLEQLHDVLQAAMGWMECHLHEFRVGQRRFGEPYPEEEFMGMPDSIDEGTVGLFDVLGRAGAKAVYTYDLGDDWEHNIKVEKVLPFDPGIPYPVCVAGELQGPPEDCGGIGGFYNLLEAIRDPAHEEHEELLEWVGGDFDPEAFSLDDVNRKLARLQRRRRKPRSG